jgi:hypothetical protein
LGLECNVCHQGPGSAGSGEACSGCHSLHHQATLECRLCHTESPRVNHRGDMAHVTACTVCHSGSDQAGLTEWSLSVCLVCHQDMEDHSGGMECLLCHEILPLPGGGGSGGGRPSSPVLHSRSR